MLPSPEKAEFLPREGDLVALKGDGSPMSVQAVDPAAGTAECVWFDAKGVLHEAKFPVRELRPGRLDSDCTVEVFERISIPAAHTRTARK